MREIKRIPKKTVEKRGEREQRAEKTMLEILIERYPKAAERFLKKLSGANPKCANRC